MSSKKVAIVGTGLSGLACGLELERNGVEVEFFEKDDSVGGRVKTDFQDGFVLDHGFQVYLSGYEMGRKYFNYNDLKLKSFLPGAILMKGESHFLLSDPLRNPGTLFKTLKNPFLNFKDKILTLKLKFYSKKADIKKFSQITTLQFLKDFGFSDLYIKSFFRPFFSGVFLEKNLETEAGFFLYLFNKFSSSHATLPEKGMWMLAENLKTQLKSKFIFNSTIQKIQNKQINFLNLGSKNYDSVVLANSDFSVLDDAADDLKKLKWNSVCTLYFKTRSDKFKSRYLYLNTSERSYVNHVACLTAVNEEYAPVGYNLFSVNVLLDQNLEIDIDLVFKDLISLFGEDQINTWDFLKAYTIKKALPVLRNSLDPKSKNGLYMCGDHFVSPSIQGALTSGYKTAIEVLNSP